jgi:peptidyl-prolyl cis-trans isomerase C
MTAAQYEAFVDALPEQYKTQAKGPGKREVVEQLVTVKGLAQEARRRKLDQGPQFKAQQAFQTENLLAGLLFRELSASLKVDEADARKHYDEHKADYERVKARHILIRFKGSVVPIGPGKKDLTDEEALEKAKALRVRILAGEDFGAIAKAESDDTASGANGGDLDEFGHGQMVGPFDQAAFAQKPGQVGEPVKTQFGYHLILVDKHEAKSFEEMRPEIEKQLTPDLVTQAVVKLKSQTTVQIDDAYFGPAAPTPPPPAK